MPATTASLVRASHPEPTVAVTALMVTLAFAVGVKPATTVVLGLAVLAGQLSIGWSNDLIDLKRDRLAGRTDKPLAGGDLSVPVVTRAIAASLVTTVVASLALGIRPGLIHCGLVACAWAYNLGLKRTVLSWLPYALCFGVIPMVVTLSAADPTWPPAWMVAAGALLGVGAHFVNVVPDLEDDARTGIRGLPHRLGRRRSLAVASALLVSGSFVTVLGPQEPVSAPGYAALLIVVILAACAALGTGRTPFRAVLAIALVTVIALVAQSS